MDHIQKESKNVINCQISGENQGRMVLKIPIEIFYRRRGQQTLKELMESYKENLTEEQLNIICGKQE